MLKYRKSFTLIELVIAIVIIGIITTVALVGFKTAQKRSTYEQILSDMSSIANAMEIYRNQYGVYPTWLYKDELKLALPSFTWPTPPCKNFRYAYEPTDNVIYRVSLRRDDTITGFNQALHNVPLMHYYCLGPNVNDTTKKCIRTATTTTCKYFGGTVPKEICDGVISEPKDIREVPGKSLDCNEMQNLPLATP